MSLGEVSKRFTEETLDAIVQKVGGTKHTSYSFGKGFNKGESYLSDVFRICIQGINGENDQKIVVNTIVKAMPSNPGRRKLFRSTVFFRNEINFYTKVLPVWEKFQEKHCAKRPFLEYPKCYAYFSDGENDFIALEDLSFDGFGGIQRTACATLEDCVLIMRTLGRFHGVSLALNALEPENFKATADSLEETYFSEKYRCWYLDFLEVACHVSKDAVSKTYPSTKYEELTNRFLQAPILFNDLCQLVSSKSKLSVISHGDCWIPNFLTRYTANNIPEETKMIDFQLARCSSLANDITFFIYSCTEQILREKHFNKLLEEYHSSACSLIKDVGADAVKIFPWNALLEELQHYGRFGCGMGIESLPMSLIDDDEVVDLDEITEESVLTDAFRIKPFEQPAKRERIAQMFKHAIDQNYIS